jgi:predicted PurR-regulated permease PerM
VSRLILTILAVAAGALLLYRLERVVLVLILALFFAYLIAPLVEVAEARLRAIRMPRRVSRGLAIGVVYLAFGGLVSAGLAALLPTMSQQVDDVVLRAPGYTQSLRTWEAGWALSYQRLRMPAEVRRRVDQSVLDAADRAAETLRESLVAGVGVLSYLPWLVLVPVLSFFLLKDAQTLRVSALHALPIRFRERARRLLEELNTTMAAYIRAQLVACLLVGAICGAGFAALGLPYAALLGVLAGVLEFIPLLGPFAVAVIAAIVAAFHAPALAFWTAGFLAVVRVVEDYVIYPRLMGRGIHLHPLAVILAVLAGIELGGVVGIFVAVPAAAAMSVAWRHGLQWRAGSAGLLGDER